MRTPIALSLVAVLLLGLTVVAVSARADGEGNPTPATDPAVRMAALEAQVAALKADVEFLRARDEALTNSLLAMSRTASNLHTGTGQARVLGFEMAAISQASRTTVLNTLDGLARDLSSALPALTQKEQDLRRKADDMMSKAWPK